MSQGRRAGQVSLEHGSGRNSHNYNNKNKNKNKNDSGRKAKPKHEFSGKRECQTSNHDKSGSREGFPPISSLEDALDSILFADALAKHIDPPFAELEDDFSRLKTQCIHLATLVLHLENKLEAEQRKHKRPSPPEAIAIRRTLPPDSSKSEMIQTTTIKAPALKEDIQNCLADPLSIIYSSTPKPWSARRLPSKTSRFQKIPQTPGAATSAASPMSFDMASPSNTQLTPTLDRLLDELHDAIQNRDGDRIALDLQIEPPLAQAYVELAQELQRHYPWGKDQHLQTLCERVLPRSSDGSRNVWESFGVHLLQYLQFIRDYAPQNLLKTNNDIKRLLKWVRQRFLPPLAPAKIRS